MLRNKIAPFFICLIIFLAGCVPVPAVPSPTLVLLTTATVATTTETPTPTEILTPAPTAPAEASQIPPEILTSTSAGLARSKAEPYCKKYPMSMSTVKIDQLFKSLYSSFAATTDGKIVDQGVRQGKYSGYAVVGTGFGVDDMQSCAYIQFYKLGSSPSGEDKGVVSMYFQDKVGDAWREITIHP